MPKRREREKLPRRTTLFVKYFRVTFSIVFVTTIAMCLVFVIFMTNYWTSTNTDTLKRNVASLVNAVSVLDKEGKFESNPEEAYLTLYIDFHTISDTLDGDFFMTDLSGNIVICKDLIDDNLEVLHEDAQFCKIHSGASVNYDILQKTTSEGYYTMERMRGLDDRICIVVGQKIHYSDGTPVGYVFGTLPVFSNLNQYVQNMVRLFAGAALVSLVFAVILVYVYSKRMTAPLREMSRITKLYARGDFSQRIEVRGNNELTDLVTKLNQMADSLETLDESRSAFVANVSHELKTPMTSIGGFIDGILDGTISQNEEKKYLKIVSSEVKRLSTLVQTMLTLSKIEAGEERLKPGKTELKSLMFTALLNFEQAINEANIEVLGFEDMQECYVVADEKMLYQVIYNLYDNAVKFTNIGGTIYVEILEELDKVTLSVANTGEGIKNEELLHIFERFYKVDKSRSEHVKGVGLGLNLAKNIVELHGGEISASSTPGELTSFSFWIPKEQ